MRGAAVDGRDVLAVLPTGYGKSLVYQLPSVLLPGLTVVVSPLIALMKAVAYGWQHERLARSDLRGAALARHQQNDSLPDPVLGYSLAPGSIFDPDDLAGEKKIRPIMPLHSRL